MNDWSLRLYCTMQPSLQDGEFGDDELPLGNMDPRAMILLYLFCSYILTVMLNGVMLLLDGDPLAHPLFHTEYISIDSWSYVTLHGLL